MIKFKSVIFRFLSFLFLSKEARLLGEELKEKNHKINVHISEHGFCLSSDPVAIRNSDEFKNIS